MPSPGASITLSAPAKVNLTLQITGRIKSGLHLLRSLVCPLSLCDEVEVSICEQPGIEIQCRFSDELYRHFKASHAHIPELEQQTAALNSRTNLAVRAAEIFLARMGLEKRVGVRIDILKRIPLQAGLAGGSADAAAVFLGLGQLLSFNSPAELLGMGGLLGADIPAVLYRRIVYMFGTGRNLAPVFFTPSCSPAQALSQLGVVVVKPLCGSSTPEAYSALGFEPLIDECFDEHGRLSSPNSVAAELEAASGILSALGLELLTFSDDGKSGRKLTLLQQEGSSGMPVRSGGPRALVSSFINDFEASVMGRSNEIKQAFDMLSGLGAMKVLLAGSGSAVLGFLPDLAQAQAVARQVIERSAEGWFVTAAHLMPEPAAGREMFCSAEVQAA